MDPLPDRSTLTQIKQYKIVRELGRGAMGTVYEGVDARDGSRVALKILHPELAASDPTFRDRFEREAHVAALLRSPYTVHLNDFGVANGIYFLVMEYVEGEALAQALENGALEPSRALQVAIAVARALEEANARGVVHRDIKPDNILLAEDGGVKVADFGIARQEGGAGATVVGGYVGTPAYSAPEQARGDADSRTDIYALGATLYCMLVGHPPFTGSSGREVLYQHQYSPVPMQPLAWLPDAITNPIRRCLEKDPRDRYQTASELAGALERATRGLTLSGLQPPPPPPAVERPSVAPLAPPPAPVLPASAAALDETLDIPPLAAASLAGEDTVTLAPPSPSETANPAAATTLVPPEPGTILPEAGAATVIAAASTTSASAPTPSPATTEVSLATPTTVAPSHGGNGNGAAGSAVAVGAAVGAAAAGSSLARAIDAPPAAPPPTAVGAMGAGSGSPPRGRSKTKLAMLFGGVAIIAVAAVGGALALSGGGGGNSLASPSATATSAATQTPGASAVANNSPTQGSASPSPADPGSPTPTLPPGETPTTAPPNNGGGGGVVPTPVPPTPTPIPPTATPIPPTATPIPPTPTPKPVVYLSFLGFYLAGSGDKTPTANSNFDPPRALIGSGANVNFCGPVYWVIGYSHSDTVAWTAPNKVVIEYYFQGAAPTGVGTWTVVHDPTWFGVHHTDGSPLPDGTYTLQLKDDVSGVAVSGSITVHAAC